MNNAFYEERKRYTIYALRSKAEDDFIYIGKTTNPRISAVYSWHICGHCSATNCYFSKEERPDLHILYEGNMTGAQAYQQIVAWVNVFKAADYAVINHEGTLTQADTPNTETRSIIYSICDEPLEDILKRTYVSRPVEADRKEHEIINPNEATKTVQMNVRMQKCDKARFDVWCKERNVNQREGVSILLDAVIGKENADLTLLSEYQKRLEKLKGDNEKLQKQNALLKGTAVSNREQKAEKLLLLNQKGIEDYLQLLFPEMEKKAPLPHYAYSKFVRHLSAGMTYEYPEEDGFFIMKLEAIVWSKSGSKACFLIGTDAAGKRVKLRYYPKWYYCGCHFLDSVWAQKEAQWYVGCSRAKDGAMEMIAGFPVACMENRHGFYNESTDENNSYNRQKPSLDSMIKNANNRR